MRKRLDLFTSGHRTRTCDLNQSPGRATATAGLTPHNLRAKRDGEVPGLCLTWDLQRERSNGKLSCIHPRTCMDGSSKLSLVLKG